MSKLIDLLHAGADEDRERRVAAATVPPQPFEPIATAPKDGTLLDVKFNPATAEPGMAEFYVQGSTSSSDPVEPVIENVAFVNGRFTPVYTLEGAEAVKALGGGRGSPPGCLYGIMSVDLTHWRPAAYPVIE
ncbi:hypothetical protein ABIC83_002867 [Roseateles asaccharophilus]|uniref:hypothetical protein n=1 Tax=Roseateles asaccharophilus TaxID=582607 RepID=UPI003838093D